MLIDFEPLMSAEDAASLLHIHVNTLTRWVREGRVPAIHVGRRVAFRASALNKWLDERYTSVAVRAAQPERMAA